MAHGQLHDDDETHLEIRELFAERDKFAELFNEWKMKGVAWTEEISRLKAEVERSEKVRWELVNQRDKIEAHTKKLAGTLKQISNCPRNIVGYACDVAKAALDEYEQEVK